MKTIKFLVTAMASLVVCAAVQARSFEDIKKDGKIVIATEGTYPPFSYFQGSKLTGLDIELGEAIAKKMGVGVEWKALSFDALLSGLRQDRWDMVMDSIGITEERAKAVSFSNPIYCSGGVIVSKDAAIHTVESLNGKTVAVLTGTTYMDSLRKLPAIKEVKNFPQDPDARSALMNGRVDAWVSDRFAVKAALEASPNSGLKKGDYLFVEKIAAAIKKGNHSLDAAINKALAEIMLDGTYHAITEKYMHEDIQCH
ncbi:ABC transporter substrate-binding protein [Collimonas humicola]|uniref:ABC transporter substrate-binding protein n=1 Tax=Collimonas humicola TaxID=2825886 RepID=UPI001B8CA1C1|nr:ABC transporter substrate-binding protein [Collimonas humicola]